MPGSHGRLLTVAFVLVVIAAAAVITMKVRADGWASNGSSGSARISEARHRSGTLECVTKTFGPIDSATSAMPGSRGRPGRR